MELTDCQMFTSYLPTQRCNLVPSVNYGIHEGRQTIQVNGPESGKN